MKTLLITTALLISATSASASWNSNNGVKWGGNTNTLHTDGCRFKDQTNGTMLLNKSTGKWTTTTAAKITVKSTNINIVSDVI